MNNVIADDRHLVNCAGLRFASKQDNVWGNKTTYHIEINYKGVTKQLQYDTDREARDRLFEKIVCALKVQKEA